MNTITPEIRKQIFAQYFGSTYYYKNSFGTYKEKVEFGYHTDKHIEYDKAFLYLTPLSKITDEDIIEVATYYAKWRKGFEVLKINRYEESISVDYRYISDEVNNADGFSYSGNGFGLSSYSLNIYQYQYLQSKGYALPYMDYSVADLVGLGVYKLK